MGHSLSIRKMSGGDIGLCTGTLPDRSGDLFPLFRVPNIETMVETLRQLSNEAVKLQHESQWEANEASL